ncbi:MAG: murein peptide amidase A [Phycisphaerales bacterium]|nr:MAG: murein peptide amidase A [Phycisphaerales bacterium]
MYVTLGYSVAGRPIRAFVGRESGGEKIVVLGAFHGDEPKSVTVARKLIDLLDTEPQQGKGHEWVVVPIVNPDGYEARRRRNANAVDINRNFPTKNWVRSPRRSRMFSGDSPGSEPETRAVIKAVKRYRPTRIISIHSIDGRRHCNNYDGPGRAIAEAMGRRNRYPVRGSMGYPTPGSFGNWAGVERGIPTITLELPSHHSPKRCWEDNRWALFC